MININYFVENKCKCVNNILVLGKWRIESKN